MPGFANVLKKQRSYLTVRLRIPVYAIRLAQVDMAPQLKVQIKHVKAAVDSHAATEVISD